MLTPVSKVVRGMVGPTYLVLHPLKLLYFRKDWYSENDHDHFLVSARKKAHISCCAADQSIDIYSKTE